IIEGLIGITSRIDDVIKLIRASDGPDEAKAELISKGFVKSDEQAQAIIDIKLGNLTKLESDKLQKEHDWIKERIDWLNKVLSADKYLLKLIV
ncbi:DNA gyrase subunit A, partial [Klebsiella pneumoniae]|uniref:DNA gyrase subunit A n=1 Tax=Klebsiella pneumoniae TaxID=573 RepID=UPI00385437CE